MNELERVDAKRYRFTKKGESLLAKVHELFSKPVRVVIADLLSVQKRKNEFISQVFFLLVHKLLL